MSINNGSNIVITGNVTPQPTTTPQQQSQRNLTAIANTISVLSSTTPAPLPPQTAAGLEQNIKSTVGPGQQQQQAQFGFQPLFQSQQQMQPNGAAGGMQQQGIQSRNISTQRPPHPHLGNQFSNEINEINYPKTQVVDAGIIDRLRNEGIIDKKGNINFSKFGTPLSRNKAKLSGSIYLEGNKLKINIEGTCGPEAAKILQQLKTAVNGDSNGPLTINPQIINISQTDKNLLARGGQIQYKHLSNGKILKLTLDPGENGQGDGLTLSVWNNRYKIKQEKAKKIPLSVVFEGQPLNGVRVLRDGRPILEDWGKRQLFENSVIKTEEEKIFFFTKTQSDNTTDIGRTEAKNTLWRSVYEYLRNTQESEQSDALQQQPSIPSPPNEAQETPKTPLTAPIAEEVEMPQVQMLEAPQPTTVERKTLSLEPQQAIEEKTADTPLQAEMAEEVEMPQVQMAETPQADKKAHPVITSAIIVDAANDVLKALQGLLASLHENNEPAQEALKQAQNAVLALESQIPETEKLQQATLLANNLTALVQILKGNSTAESNLQPLLDAAQNLSKEISELATQLSVSAPGQAATSIPETNTPLKATKAKINITPTKLSALKDAAQVLSNAINGLQHELSANESAIQQIPTQISASVHGMKVPMPQQEIATEFPPPVFPSPVPVNINKKTGEIAAIKAQKTTQKEPSTDWKSKFISTAMNVDKAFQDLRQAAQESQTDETKPQLKAVEEEAFRVTR